MYRLILTLVAMMACAPAFGQTVGTDAWVTIFQAFSHPRCANCHVADGVPMWTGPEYRGGRHGMYVGGFADSQMGAPGQTCDICHGPTNAPVPHGPPGAEYWLLAPANLAWFGKTSAKVCAQTRDPARNGGYTAAQLADRMASNPMVLWAWDPGEWREPAPGSISALAEALRAWDAAGTPCPED
jgi:hypothetical protein